jgi:hypothetical protein
MRARWYGLLAGVALFGIALPALGWVFQIPFNARVNGHQFDRIRAEATDCELGLMLWFDAPADKYDSRATNRNHHRFRARVAFKNGKTVVTKVFFNNAPGRRAYRTRIDTAGEGCWAKQKTEIQKIDVEGCRAKGCTVKEFD